MTLYKYSQHIIRITDFFLNRDKDAEGKKLHNEYEKAKKKSEESELTLTALTMIKTGAVPETVAPEPEPEVIVAPVDTGKSILLVKPHNIA